MRFCIICNYVNKIIPAIQSRCTRFRSVPRSLYHGLLLTSCMHSFAPLPQVEVEKRLNHVIKQEK